MVAADGGDRPAGRPAADCDTTALLGLDASPARIGALGRWLCDSSDFIVTNTASSSSPPTSQWHAALRAAAGQISFFTPRANEQTPPRRIPSRASRHCSHGHLRAGFLTRRAPKRRNTIAFLECRGFLRNRLLAHGKSASRRLAATKAPDYILPFEVEVGGPESRAKTSAVTCTLFCRIARLLSGRLHIESCLQPVSCSVDCCRLPPPSQ